MKNFKKGFTLIELLVVVAIIGILASVVLASLNSARSKGSDAAIKANLANMRAQAELIYDDTTDLFEGYANVCDQSNIMAALDAAALASGNSANQACFSDADGWAATVPLKTNALIFWCVDSTGASREAGAAATTTECPAAP